MMSNDGPLTQYINHPDDDDGMMVSAMTMEGEHSLFALVSYNITWT